MPEQWQLTLDVIKTKAQTLLIKNNEIKAEYLNLRKQAQDVEQTLRGQQDKNEAIRLLLNQRHGRTDQQVRLEGLQQTIKIKRRQAAEFQEQLENLKKKQSTIERRQREPKKANPTPEAVGAPDGQLTDLRRQLEEEKKQEVILEDQLSSLKSGGPSQNLDVHAIEEVNKQLEAQLKDLQEQKLKKFPGETLGISQQRKYDELKKRKDQLEDAIRAYEKRLDQLKYSSGFASSWAVEKKKLIHAMVQKDARNNQLREKIKILREDVDILKDQVAKLERRVNFMQGSAHPNQ